MRHNAAELADRPKKEQKQKRAEDLLRRRLDKAKKAKKFNKMQEAEIATFEEAFKRMVSEAKQTTDIHKREIIEPDQVANSEKRRHSFDLESAASTSPSDAKKARTLQAAPTDASLPDVGKQ